VTFRFDFPVSCDRLKALLDGNSRRQVSSHWRGPGQVDENPWSPEPFTGTYTVREECLTPVSISSTAGRHL